MKVWWKVNETLSNSLRIANRTVYNSRAMSDSARAKPLVTDAEIAQLRSTKLTAKHFGSPANVAEKRSRAAWEAKKAARQAKK